MQRAQRSKEILRVPYVDLSLLEMERINRTRTEQSIRQLEAQEQRLLSEYQSSLVLSQSLRKMLVQRSLEIGPEEPQIGAHKVIQLVRRRILFMMITVSRLLNVAISIEGLGTHLPKAPEEGHVPERRE